MIQTNEFALQKNDYLKILLLLRLRRSWLLILLIGGYSAYNLRELGSGAIGTFLIIYLTLITLSSILWVYSKDNRNIYLPRKLQFSSEKITSLSIQNTVFDTPTTNEVANSQIIKKLKLNNFYLLYTSKAYFLVVPKNVFQSEDDREQFERLYRFS